MRAKTDVDRLRLNAGGRPKPVTILDTGGTLAKTYNEFHEALELKDAMVLRRLLDQGRVGDITILGLKLIDSTNMDDIYRAELHELIANADTDAVVIVHGTTTIALTAEYLDGLGVSKTVVLTGAVLPASMFPVEPAMNLGLAIAAARYLGVGVYIALHGIVERAGGGEIALESATFRLKKGE